MEGFILLIVIVAIVGFIYNAGHKSGKREGSRKGFGVGFNRGRRGRPREGKGCLLMLVAALAVPISFFVVKFFS